jgi:hypothetical protein
MKVLVGTKPFGESEQNSSLLDAVAIRKLASEITGHVITPEASNYESLRLVNNRAYDRHPALIVHCVSASDVVRTLDFAQKQSLPLAVRAGGHSAAGYGVCDRGVVIDLSGMKRVEVDAHKRVARVDAKFTGSAPDELSSVCQLLPSEGGPRFQMGVAYYGQPSLGNDLLRPLRAQLKPQEDRVKTMSHLDAQRMWFPTAAAKPSGYFIANLFLSELSEAAIEAITAAAQDAPQRFWVLIGNFHGAVTASTRVTRRLP